MDRGRRCYCFPLRSWAPAAVVQIEGSSTEILPPFPLHPALRGVASDWSYHRVCQENSCKVSMTTQQSLPALGACWGGNQVRAGQKQKKVGVPQYPKRTKVRVVPCGPSHFFRTPSNCHPRTLFFARTGTFQRCRQCRHSLSASGQGHLENIPNWPTFSPTDKGVQHWDFENGAEHQKPITLNSTQVERDACTGRNNA